MTLILSGSDGVTFPDSTEQETGYANGIGFRNRIINGDMRIDQRNAGAAVNPATNNDYCIDRWLTNTNVASKYSVQQNAGSVTPPTGFTNYLGATSLSAYSVVSTDSFALVQKIEGYNFADLDFGKATAKTVTISFWVRSSLTGTFGGSLTNGAVDRSYPFTYTVSSADTWEQKSVTIAGDTSGTWLTGNGIGAWVWFGLGMGPTLSGTAGAWAGTDYRSATGATSVVGTSGATFYITGVQLEVGSVATPFERRPYGTELSLCQRYYVRWNASDAFSYFTSGLCYDNTSAVVALANPVQMRAQPTWGAPSNCRLYDGTTASLVTSISVNRSSVLVSSGNFTTGSISFVQSNPVVVSANNNSAAYLEVTAEL